MADGSNPDLQLWEPVRRARLFVEQDSEQPRLFEFQGSHVALFSTRCPDAARPSEDGAALIPCAGGGGVIVVADGVGGAPAGARAALTALDAMASSLARADDEGVPSRAGILNGFEAANRAVLQMGTGAATTLTAVEYNAGAIRTYHVGDSEAVVVGQRGKVKLQTVSHTPSGYGLEAGLLNEHEASVHEERHVVLNLVGSPDMRIEMSSHRRLSPRDTLLVGSDGLFDNWPYDELLDRIRIGRLRDMAAELARATLDRMSRPGLVPPAKPDDVTFVLLRRGDAGTG